MLKYIFVGRQAQLETTVYQEPSNSNENPHHPPNSPHGPQPGKSTDPFFGMSLGASSDGSSKSAANRSSTPGDQLPSNFNLSGKLGRDHVVDLITLGKDEIVVGVSSDASKLATFSEARANKKNGIDGTVRVYDLNVRNDAGDPTLVSSQGFRCKFAFPPTIVPFVNSPHALIVEDGHPLNRLHVSEAKRYSSMISVLELGNDPAPSRKHLSLEQYSPAYSATALLSTGEELIFLKGKRIPSWVEGLRGYEAVEIIEVRSVPFAKLKAENLYSNPFRRTEGEGRYSAACAMNPAGDFLLSAAAEKITLVPIDNSQSTTSIPVSLPTGAKIAHLEFDAEGKNLALLYKLERENHLRIYSLSGTGKPDLSNIRSETTLRSAAHSISFNRGATMISLSGAATDLYEFDTTDKLSLIGSSDVSAARFVDETKMISFHGGQVVSFDTKDRPMP